MRASVISCGLGNSEEEGLVIILACVVETPPVSVLSFGPLHTLGFGVEGFGGLGVWGLGFRFFVFGVYGLGV